MRVRRALLLPVVLVLAQCAREPQYAQGPYGYAQPAYAQPAYPGPAGYPAQPYPQPAYPPQPAYAAPAAYAPYATPLAIPDTPYTLDSGDRLRVVVFGQDGLTSTYAVDSGGNLSMPLIGAVPARGLTTHQLASEIGARLKDGYIRDPQVAVEVETYRPFFILGEVAFPGQYPYVANMTVETAVAIAGGFSPRAKRDAVDLSRPYNGQIVKGTVPVTTPVRPGDTINVAERWF